MAFFGVAPLGSLLAGRLAGPSARARSAAWRGDVRRSGRERSPCACRSFATTFGRSTGGSASCPTCRRAFRLWRILKWWRTTTRRERRRKRANVVCSFQSTPNTLLEKQMTKDEILQKIASGELSVDAASKALAELEQPKRGSLYCKVSEKGGLSVYGLQTHAGHALHGTVGAAAGLWRRNPPVHQGPRRRTEAEREVTVSASDPGESPVQSCCPGGTCGIERRDFIAALATGGAAAALSAMTVMAGPFEAADSGSSSRPTRKLDPQWVASLTARGAREVYRGKELDKIGMPIGGICAGQLYLGGDGQALALGHFQPPDPHGRRRLCASAFARIAAGTGFRCARSRPRASRRFASSISAVSPMSTFCGEYPLAFVEYRDPQLAGQRVARSVFAVHPAQHGRFEPAGDGAAIHREQYRHGARRRCELGRLAGKRRGPVLSGAGAAERRNDGSERSRPCC